MYGYRYGEYARWYLGFKNKDFFFQSKLDTRSTHGMYWWLWSRHDTFFDEAFLKVKIYCLSSRRLLKLLKPFKRKTRNKSVVGQNEKYWKARLTWRPVLITFTLAVLYLGFLCDTGVSFAVRQDNQSNFRVSFVASTSKFPNFHRKSRIWNGLCFTLVEVHGLKIGYWNNQYMLILWYWFVSPLLIIKSRNTISNTLDKKFCNNLPNSSMVH